MNLNAALQTCRQLKVIDKDEQLTGERSRLRHSRRNTEGSEGFCASYRRSSPKLGPREAGNTSL